MTTVYMSNPGFDLGALFEKITRTKKPVKIRDKKNAYVLLSDEDWRGIQETNHLKSIPGMMDSIVEGMKAKHEECYSLEDIGWTIK